MSSEDITITAIRPTGAPLRKGGYDGKQFVADVEYTLETGAVQPGSISRSRKRDLVAELAELAGRDGLPSHPMRATYHDGRFVGTSTTYRLLGGSR